VAVTLFVNPPPPPQPQLPQPQQLSVNPSSLSFSYQIDSNVPAAQSFQVTSSGAPVTFTATASSSRLSITPVNGTTPQLLTVTVNPDGLAPGTYNDTITVTSSNTSGPAVVLASVVVTGPPATLWYIVLTLGLGLVGVIGFQQRRIRNMVRSSLRAEVETESPILETDSDGVSFVQLAIRIQVTSEPGEQNVIADNDLVREVKEQ
jgi:hypothetical protein